MALKNTITFWNDGVNAYMEEEYEEAVEKFQQIEDPSARIYFNIAMSLLRVEDIRGALTNLNETVKKDPHLAIGHFCRGLLQTKFYRYEAAIQDFDKAVEKLRSNNFIDYSQLGMEYKLLISEIWIAKAITMTTLGKGFEAEQFLIAASQNTDDDEARNSCIAAVQKLQEHKEGVTKLKRLSLRNQDWFHGNLPRSDAEGLLHHQGDFLIRESRNKKTNDTRFVLSIVWNGFRHILIIQDDNENWKFEGHAFPTIQELVEYQHSSGKPVTKKSKARLLKPIFRSSSETNIPEINELPDYCIFHPPKELIKNLEKRNYLGKAKVISALGQTVRRKERAYKRRNEDGDEETLERPDHGSNSDLPPKPSRPPPETPKNTQGSHSSVSSQRSNTSIQTFYSRRPPPELPRDAELTRSLSRSMEDISTVDEPVSVVRERNPRPVNNKARYSDDLAAHGYVNTKATRKDFQNPFNNELANALNLRQLKDTSNQSDSSSQIRNSRENVPQRPPPPRRK